MNKISKYSTKAQSSAVSGEEPNAVGTKLRKRQRYGKLFFTAMCVVSMMVAFGCTAFAANDIAGKIASGLSEVFDIIQSIAIPIGIIALGFAGYQFIFGGQKGMEAGKKTLIYIVIGFAVIFLAPVAAEQIAGWFAGSNSFSWDGHLPT